MRQPFGSPAIRAIIAAAAALALVLPATASAHRPAGRAEKAAMVYGASGRYYYGLDVAEPRSIPLRCFRADISTVVRGSRWGAWTYSKYAYSHLRKCRTGNGLAIGHKIGGRWYVYWEGSEGYPPVHSRRSGRYTIKGVPRAVAKDLEQGLG